MQSDEEVVGHQFKNILEVNEVEINKIERITVKQKDGRNRPSPKMMIVKTGSPYQKVKVLKSAKDLAKGPWKHVFINRDMSKTEQEQDYKLRLELKNRKECGEKNLMIKGGSVVTKDDRASVNAEGPILRSRKSLSGIISKLTNKNQCKYVNKE
ncbi:hypothetical protein Pmani_015964 [Petrolisthes manimaculis]|uniref:Uncharacterized protein n=1 Tax=Petrolisthes manimaculis TaxID=1843537 RepID=A0AAE1PTB3_9EUCA|nr:hypothetical protein Pmani_015964 [Petrolisthes manimaculis]